MMMRSEKGIKYQVSKWASLMVMLFAANACYDPNAPKVQVDYYVPSMHQAPPEAAYSREMWSALPEPLPAAADKDAPLISPKIVLEMKNTTVSDASRALASSIGYRLECPKELGERRLSVKISGGVDEIATEIAKKGGVKVAVDEEARVVRVAPVETTPLLLE